MMMNLFFFQVYVNQPPSNSLRGFFMAEGDDLCQEELEKKNATNIVTKKEKLI
jgi:hypothetical protein